MSGSAGGLVTSDGVGVGLRFTPPVNHRLRRLYALLDDGDKAFVDDTVRSAVDESATGAVPFGLPNVASAALRGGAPLGETDPAEGYAEMDAAAFFALLDAEWSPESSQYLGADRHFVVGSVVRTDTRVLAGGILVCLGLAEQLSGGTQHGKTS